MSIKAVLFDLDGTLLPMDPDVFVKDYFGRLARYLVPHGVDPERLIPAIWQGSDAMTKNDGSVTNDKCFWAVMDRVYGEGISALEPVFKRFYEEEFGKVSASCGHDPEAATTIAALKAKGYRLVLATSPLFPRAATEWRMSWAGVSADDFELVTTYENSCHSKPNLDYYRDILATLGLAAEECLMVGNDVGEDMIAEEIGMSVYLTPRDLINRKGKDISGYKQGRLSEIFEKMGL